MNPESRPETDFAAQPIHQTPPLEGGMALSPPDTQEPNSLTTASETTPAPRRRKQQEEAPRSYYDVSMLKPPVWKWEIATYFFLGGLSAGAYILARMASRFGGKRYRDIEQAGTFIAAAALVPCPPLLIRDLGDWKRFHYMLRVFKPKSPMSVGSWTLTGYGAFVTLAALNEWRKAKRTAKRRGKSRRFSAHKPDDSTPLDGVINAALDGAGVPLALLLAGYTGVLLSTSANPLWARNNWLGALFSASALSSGAAAIELALELRTPNAETQPSRKPLKQIEAVARVAEAVTLAGYLTEAGKLAAPITKGKYAPHLWGGAVGAGLVGSALLGAVPVKNPKTRRALRIAGAVAGLAGGLALRWAISQGGHISGSDPQAARDSSRAVKPDAGETDSA